MQIVPNQDEHFNLNDILLTNWRDIDTRARLRGCLLSAIRRLRKIGHTTIANDWRNRLSAMPTKITTEQKNLILYAACQELIVKQVIDRDGNELMIGGAS